MPRGNWQVPHSGWRLKWHIFYVTKIAPIICLFGGHAPELYSELPTFAGLLQCSRCLRVIE